jgi:CheY-like chemotaxis protein
MLRATWYSSRRAMSEACPSTPAISFSDLPGGRETVLLVEDEPLLLDVALCSLQQLGYHVVPCASAEEALLRFGQFPGRIDLLFTDVMMPRMNGKTLAAKVKALAPDIDVLFSSGLDETLVVADGQCDATIHTLAKPYRLHELATKLREIFDAKQARRAPGVAKARSNRDDTSTE